MEKIKGFSGSTIKIIAVVAMIIDHIGRGIWYRLPGFGLIVPEMMDMETWWFVYRTMRNIGRIAFPIFCFLLVEGFFHTRSNLKYFSRLLIFALISQLPYYYAFLELEEGTNVLFTLFIGLAAIWAMDAIKQRWEKKPFRWNASIIFLTGWILIVASACGLAFILNTDYDYKGILLIVVLYVFHNNRLVALVTGYFSFKLAMFYSSTFVGGFLKYLGADYYFPGFICLWNF